MVVQQIRPHESDRFAASAGKQTRLSHMLFEHGPGRALLLVLSVDQGFEHGTTDFVGHPESADLDFQKRLPIEGGYSAEVTVQAA